MKAQEKRARRSWLRLRWKGLQNKNNDTNSCRKVFRVNSIPKSLHSPFCSQHFAHANLIYDLSILLNIDDAYSECQSATFGRCMAATHGDSVGVDPYYLLFIGNYFRLNFVDLMKSGVNMKFADGTDSPPICIIWVSMNGSRK